MTRAEVTATFTRFPDGGVSLRMLRPSGVVHGDTHLEALAAGLWMVRIHVANLRRIAEMDATRGTS